VIVAEGIAPEGGSYRIPARRNNAFVGAPSGARFLVIVAEGIAPEGGSYRDSAGPSLAFVGAPSGARFFRDRGGGHRP
jgi:hypothetical protein